MKKIIIQLFVLFTILSYQCVSAQKIQVNGTVVTFNSIPIVNAKVMNQNTEEVVFTDKKGEFTCSSNIKDKLIISANGFGKKRIKVGKIEQVLVVNLKLNKSKKAEEIAINNGHIELVESFKKLAKQNSKQKDYSKYNSVVDIIKTEFSSVQYINGKFVLRGLSSVQGSSEVGVEIDGSLSNYNVLNSISTNDIKKIRIVKGGDAAIYGIRGTNGIISVTTYSGKY